MAISQRVEKPPSADVAGLCRNSSGARMIAVVVLLRRERLQAHRLPQRRVGSSHCEEEDEGDAHCLEDRGGHDD